MSPREDAQRSPAQERRIYQTHPHTLFAAAMAALPPLGAKVLGVGDFGTSLTLLFGPVLGSSVWRVRVRPHGDEQAVLKVEQSSLDPQRTLPPTPIEEDMARTLLDAVSFELEKLSGGRSSGNPAEGEDT